VIMNTTDANYITTDDFLRLLEKVTRFDQNILITQGVINQSDIVNADKHICRLDVARILHELLVKIIHEEDEQNWSSALCLRDLYDCHTCVYHIAQIYSKGIIEPYSDNVFATREHITIDDANRYVNRVFDITIRAKVRPLEIRYEEITLDDYKKINEENRLFIDLRDEIGKEDYIVENALHLSLKEISQNPYRVSSDRLRPIYVMCKRGYQSAVAAQLLIKAGYANVTKVIE